MSPATGKIESQLTCPSPLSSKILNYTGRLIAGFRRGGVELSPEFVALRNEYVKCCRDFASRRDSPNPKDWDVEALYATLSMEISYAEGPFFWTYMLPLADRNERKKPPFSEFCLVKYAEDGKLLWKSPLPGVGMITAETQDRIFISSGTDIICFNKENGAELWKFPAIPDQSHGSARPHMLLFQDYVAIFGENIDRPDHPHKMEPGKSVLKSETDLILVRQDTGKEVFFYPFRDIAGDVFSGASHIYLVSSSGTAVCLGSPPTK
jgi:outer membrane protein assembly factor BamB